MNIPLRTAFTVSHRFWVSIGLHPTVLQVLQFPRLKIEESAQGQQQSHQWLIGQGDLTYLKENIPE